MDQTLHYFELQILKTTMSTQLHLTISKQGTSSRSLPSQLKHTIFYLGFPCSCRSFFYYWMEELVSRFFKTTFRLGGSFSRSLSCVACFGVQTGLCFNKTIAVRDKADSMFKMNITLDALCIKAFNINSAVVCITSLL